MPVPARVDEPRGAVDQQAEAPEARLALQAGDEIVGQRDALERGAEDELTRMEDERLPFRDLDELGQILLGLLRVDEGRGVVAEDAEVAVDVEVDGAGLHRAVGQWVDDDAARGQLVADRAVRQDHGGAAYRPSLGAAVGTRSARTVTTTPHGPGDVEPFPVHRVARLGLTPSRLCRVLRKWRAGEDPTPESIDRTGRRA